MDTSISSCFWNLVLWWWKKAFASKGGKPLIMVEYLFSYFMSRICHTDSSKGSTIWACLDLYEIAMNAIIVAILALRFSKSIDITKFNGKQLTELKITHNSHLSSSTSPPFCHFKQQWSCSMQIDCSNWCSTTLFPSSIASREPRTLLELCEFSRIS